MTNNTDEVVTNNTQEVTNNTEEVVTTLRRVSKGQEWCTENDL